jgi:hypothetical protein
MRQRAPPGQHEHMTQWIVIAQLSVLIVLAGLAELRRRRDERE